MSVKIGTTPETLVKSRLSCVVPIIYHSHPLHDAAGGGQQPGIGDAQEHVAGGLVRAVEPDKGDFSVQRDVGTVTVNSDGGIFGTVADDRPQDSILILTQRRLPEKSKRQNMLNNSQIAKMKDIQP